MGEIHPLAGRGDPFELLARLEAGADPNDATGRHGRTPLMEAAKHDHRVAARLLLRFGAKTDVADGKERTALLDSSTLDMKRLLLDAGANPDFGKIGGMTLMAFFASFGDRERVELFRSYGADTGEKIRKGPTVQEALDDPSLVWRNPGMPDTPEMRQSHAEFVRKHSDDLRISPEAYVAQQRHILLWGLHGYPYDDPRLAEWASAVAALLDSPDRLEAAYRQHLEGEELQSALCSLIRPRQRAERDARRKARIAEFETFYFGGES